ncbi:SpoIIE family protein phosphatase [Flammeovirga yaeyamensis]|uniref:SpoIIE family protein phosphatase n=1 Tax=Flammeovirga yaeyamensis TaxID=367791 RepID=A0AAX1N754_9BACT|nr:SpoIIE family protein phosphatase [Flammeovirga yaeyamensis]MBB3701162.1 serine phosphatase RsbU (regulator of sigma subunit) [Flammeovirga yaeyamensis]NMF38371.1 SpoIIE family protein phosphatase [Flammeovirga yaeyamensis]QWG01628.1 SpoIIE family protein phosphatase [Flammeovirga yaeyamensis]
MTAPLGGHHLLYATKIEMDKEMSFWRKVKFSLAFVVFFSFVEFFILDYQLGAFVVFTGIPFLGVIYFLKGKVKWEKLCTAYIVILITALLVFSLISGGMQSHAIAWIATTLITSYWFLGKEKGRLILIYSVTLISSLFVIELIHGGPLLEVPLKHHHLLFINWLFDLGILLNISNDIKSIDIQTTSFQNKLKQNSDELIQFGEELSQTNEEMNAQKEEIESQRDAIEQHHMELTKSMDQVTDSIRYAETIQVALLTRQNELDKIFSEASVLYKPKDHVSGDFYFARQYGNKTLMVVGDCTGHGVPGALLSMVGLEALDRLEELPESPAILLEQLDGYFFDKLRQSDIHGNRDGMDISVAYVDQEYNLSFAGAKGKGLIVDENGITPLKSTNRSIGGAFQRKRRFEVTKLKIQPDTMICLYSDGFVDQNGINGKIGTLKFREMLQRYYLKYTKDCIKELDTYLRKEMSDNYQQRDDITIFLAIPN